MRLLNHAVEVTNSFISRMPKSKRKKYGQFFTSKETAVFMAALFAVPKDRSTISILDPGAGSGILSIALIERLASIDSVDKIHLVCYENDQSIVDLLRSNLEWACNQICKQVTYTIIEDNYILRQSVEYNGLLGADPFPDKFDLVIGNPPYMKIAKDAPEAMAMRDVCYGAPNLYFLFAAMSMFNLKESGEMVYIVPRSWTSGAYFKQFRKRFFETGVIKHVHLFVSRNKVFENESVLQETIILRAKKTRDIPETIKITTTQSNADFSEHTSYNVPYSTVVSDNEHYVFLPSNAEEVRTLTKLNRWTNTLPEMGLKMKTGLTVDFRNRNSLRDHAEKEAIPLFYAQHIQNGKVVFPIGRDNEYIVTAQDGLMQKNGNYLFVKRFTAKEERRRLQCGVYLARKNPQYDNISTQNKINFIGGTYDLPESVVYGLYVLLNSTLYDSYYRILNGSTQVNSTEMNSMPMPTLKTIKSMGEELIRIKDMSETTCDRILEEYL